MKSFFYKLFDILLGLILLPFDTTFYVFFNIWNLFPFLFNSFILLAVLCALKIKILNYNKSDFHMLLYMIALEDFLKSKEHLKSTLSLYNFELYCFIKGKYGDDY